MRLSAILLTMIIFSAGHAEARQQIRIVGSSTVYPFVATVAETFGRETEFKTPVVEATGTGGGFKLFCHSVGKDSADLINASRPIKDSETKLCNEHGVTDILEVKIGYDGIVLASSLKGPELSVTTEELFLALAKRIPGPDQKLIDNNKKLWTDVNPNLPAVAISVYGPPPTSGTRDSLVELVMEHGCAMLPAYKAAYPDEKERKKQCALIREDGAFVEAGEDDNIIVQKLAANENAFGLFGYSFFEENADKVKAATIDGYKPTMEAIGNGKYSISRPLYVYAKMQHVGMIPGIMEFLQELVSEKAAGPEGYLSLRGLVPMPEKERTAVASKLQ